MGIQKDAGEILSWIYKNYLESTKSYINISPQKILEETKWDSARMNRAVSYLHESGLITIRSGLGALWTTIDGITPEGINIIENSDKFKGKFGFSINLGLVTFSWEKKA